MTGWIEIDGAKGEGGGQVLRSCLALSIISGTPVHIRRVRAGRRRPGLMRQHLTALRAAAAVGAAHVEGDELGSTDVRFEPHTIVAGHHRFAVGTAGSCTLVLQTIMWPLLLADAPSQVRVEGGTHNPMAPPFDFLARTLLPRLHALGFDLELSLARPGFYPAGGGAIEATLRPSPKRTPAEWTEREPVGDHHAEAWLSRLPAKIAKRELTVVHEQLRWPQSRLYTKQVEADGPGNVLLLYATHGPWTTVVSAMGEKGRPAEDVAAGAVDEYRRFSHADVPVDEHLADQLLIPLALSGGGRFRTLAPTLHTRTNAEIVERFLPVSISLRELDDAWEVAVEPRAAAS